MTDQTTEDEATEQSAGARRSRSSALSVSSSAGQPSALQTPQGSTNINDSVVTKVAGIAAREVPGVHDLGGGVTRAMGTVTQAVGVGPDQRAQGVSVEVGEEEAAVDLVVVIDYGESIPQVSDQIRENVIQRIEGITGLRVPEVNISVRDLYFPGDDES